MYVCIKFYIIYSRYLVYVELKSVTNLTEGKTAEVQHATSYPHFYFKKEGVKN